MNYGYDLRNSIHDFDGFLLNYYYYFKGMVPLLKVLPKSKKKEKTTKQIKKFI